MREVDELQPPTYCIDGLITDHGLTLVWGASGSFKSFIVLDWCLHMVYGKKYHDREVMPRKVLYIAGEGGAGYKNRLAAWRKFYKLDFSDDYNQINYGINLTSQEEVEELLDVIRESKHSYDILVIDTVARAMVGLDENDAVNMGLFVSACDQIRQRLNCGLIAVHHAGKNTEAGPRGSSALRAAVDTEFFIDHVKDTTLVTVDNRKQKDDEEAEPYRLFGKKVELTSLGIGGETSLVFRPDNDATNEELNPHMTVKQSNEMLAEIGRAWSEGMPWSADKRAKKGTDKTFRESRCITDWAHNMWPHIAIKEIEDTIQSLVNFRFIKTVERNNNTKMRGDRKSVV